MSHPLNIERERDYIMKTVRRVVGTVETGLSSCGCYQVTQHKVFSNARVAKKAGAWNVTPVTRKRTGSGTFVSWWSHSAGWIVTL